MPSSFEERYQLLKCVAVSDGVRTHNALERSTGRVVMVHLLDMAGPEAVEAISVQVARLPPIERKRVLETATLAAGFALVTEFLQGMTSFTQWLQARIPPGAVEPEASPLPQSIAREIDLSLEVPEAAGQVEPAPTPASAPVEAKVAPAATGSPDRPSGATAPAGGTPRATAALADALTQMIEPPIDVHRVPPPAGPVATRAPDAGAAPGRPAGAGDPSAGMVPPSLAPGGVEADGTRVTRRPAFPPPPTADRHYTRHINAPDAALPPAAADERPPVAPPAARRRTIPLGVSLALNVVLLLVLAFVIYRAVRP
jgi:hypothetical protein